MGRLLLPDAGPLFSLAAGELLEVLLNFELVISDVVKQETIDRGAGKCASFEAISLADFYARHQQFIHIEPTQIGHLAGNVTKRHAGELSIQSLLINATPGTTATILFEDKWFIRNRHSFPLSCVLMTTAAFLDLLEEAGLIVSAKQAERNIRLRRPYFPAEHQMFDGGPSTPAPG